MSQAWSEWTEPGSGKGRTAPGQCVLRAGRGMRPRLGGRRRRHGAGCFTELGTRSHDEPDVALALTVGVAGLIVLGVVVERDIVVGKLLRAVGAINRAQRALDAWRQHHHVSSRHRGPGGGAIAFT